MTALTCQRCGEPTIGPEAPRRILVSRGRWTHVSAPVGQRVHVYHRDCAERECRQRNAS